MLEKIMLEQFIEGLPTGTEWVRCHQLPDLAAAVTLAEDHLMVHSKSQSLEGQPVAPNAPTPAVCRRALLLPAAPGPHLTFSRPSPAPRSNPPMLPSHRRFQPLRALLSTHRGSSSARAGVLEVQVARECPLIEVGQVVRVIDPPTPSPGPGRTYSVLVRIQGGIHQATVDLGYMQSIIPLNLV